MFYRLSSAYKYIDSWGTLLQQFCEAGRTGNFTYISENKQLNLKEVRDQSRIRNQVKWLSFFFLSTKLSVSEALAQHFTSVFQCVKLMVGGGKD